MNTQPKSLSNIFYRTLHVTCVASGTISQNNTLFEEFSKNRQCVAISVAACVYIKHVQRDNLTTATVDSLIIEGDAYYMQSKKRLGSNHKHYYLTAEETAPLITLQNHTYEVVTDYMDAGIYPNFETQLALSSNELEDKLNAMFLSYPESGFVFIGLYVAVSFWKSESLYYLFDSHSCDRNGRHCLGGVGRILSFTNLNMIATFLMMRSPFNNSDRPYEITRIDSSQQLPISKTAAANLNETHSTKKDTINYQPMDSNVSLPLNNVEIYDKKRNSTCLSTLEDVVKKSKIRKVTDKSVFESERVAKPQLAKNQEVPKLNAEVQVLLDVTCVASGTISQNSSLFEEFSRNRQCVPISVAACVYIKHVRRDNLTTATVDSLIIEGDAYYIQSKKRLGSNHKHYYLTAEETAPLITLENHTYKVVKDYMVSGIYPNFESQLALSSNELEDKLNTMFLSYPESGFVFIGLYVAISFWKSESLYYLFDSHSCNPHGRHCLGGVGRIFSFSNLNMIATFLMMRSPFNNSDRAYEITRIDSCQQLLTSQITSTAAATQNETHSKKKRTIVNKPHDSDAPVSLKKVEDYDKKLNSPCVVILEDVAKENKKPKITNEFVFKTKNAVDTLLAENHGDPKLNAKISVVLENIDRLIGSYPSGNETSTKRKPGRPKKTNRGRPKTSLLTREDQLKDASKKFKENNPQANYEAVKLYTETHPQINRDSVKTYSQDNPQMTRQTSNTYNKTNPGKHLPTSLRKGSIIAEYRGKSLDDIKPYTLEIPSLRSPNIYKCPHCGARLFKEEQGKTQWCCGQGKYNVMKLPPLNDPIYNDRRFLERPRRYNDKFGFCVFNVPQGYHHPKGLSFMKILGRTVHKVFDLNSQGINNSFLFIDDQQAEIDENERKPLLRDVVNKIEQFLKANNPYISLYRKLSEEPSEKARLEFQITSRRTHGPRLGDRPVSTEVAALLNCDDSTPPRGTFCIWKYGSESPRAIDQDHYLIEPMTYPLLYPHGQVGWYIGRPDNTNSVPPKKISLLRYTRCLLLSEERFSRFGPLSETWLIDMYARIEWQRLSYIQYMQKKAREQGGLRSGPMDEVAAAVGNMADDEIFQGQGGVIPGRTFIPSSFTGGPSYMKVCYMDAMALVSRLGGPTYFLTFTACGGWDEIKKSKHPCSKHEAHVCNRVFEIKRLELMRDIQSGKFFGKIAYVVWVIEFQMRGLPHAHICFRVADGGPTQNTEIDRVIRADIPDVAEGRGKLQQLVLRHMRHGPCGPPYMTNLPCWDQDTQRCTKFFPKPHTDTTYVDDRGFVNYKRNSDNKVLHKLGKDVIEVDDRWIVPYNAALLLKYESHVNLEIASTRRVVKYLFKYISKGSSLRRVRVSIEDNADFDEVDDYVTKRYIGATDAAWRILGFDLTGRTPTVVKLPVHLEGMQNVVFRPDSIQDAIDKSTSLLILYFNRPRNTELDRLTYLDFYEHYRVHAKKPNASLKPVLHQDGKHYVTRRVRGECIGRLAWVSAALGEQYYLKILLSRYPCHGYTDLYALGGSNCETFQQAARVLGLADDKNEYFDALDEAGKFMKADKLRQFFVLLSTIGSPVPDMWENFKRTLCEDFLEIHINDEEKAFKLGLIHIDRCLRRHGSSLVQAGLPEVEDDSTELGRERLNYSTSIQKSFVEEWEPRLSLDQLGLFNYIKTLISGKPDNKVIFLDGPGGSGKTLLLKVIAAYVRSLDKVVLCVASSGIAAQNLPGGTTAHSLYRIPLELRDDSIWSITNGSQRAELIREASLLIFDEAPMAHKRLIETIDRSLRDLMQNDLLFGNKIIIFSGDFRQIPPVVEHAMTPEDIIRASIRRSYVWRYIKSFSLVQTHRITGDDDYAQFLLKIGSDTVEKHKIGEGKETVDLVPIPRLSYVTTVVDLISLVFPKELLRKPDECANNAIICTLNNNVKEINGIIQAQLDGELHRLFSFDSVADDEGTGLDIDEGLLHHAQGRGVPDHVLLLKVGSLCIVTRNLNFDLGLVNGTKVVIVNITRRLITCRKPGSNELFGIPRITFKFPLFANSPIEMYRRQFPLQLCYAITIHKSQGQTIDFVGLDLRSDCFTHGQLYVALSRVRSPENIRLLVPPQRVIRGVPYSKNVVYKRLF